MISISNLTKKFQNGKGIHNVDLSVEKGEVMGFIGPNGAGKSTTIRHLMGFMKSDEGTAMIQGLDCFTQAADVQKMVGYLPGEIAFFDGMNGLDFLNLMGNMRGTYNDDYRNELIHRFQFDVKTPIRKMSKGMKQKVGIIAAFMHRPNVLLLDEPTSGLDPLMQNIFMDLVLEHKQRGAAILMSSHIFSEIDRVCDQLAIIKDGRIIVSSPVDALEKKQFVKVTVKDEVDVEKLKHSPLVIEACKNGVVTIRIEDNYSTIFQELSRVQVLHMETYHEKLEDLFINYYEAGGQNHEYSTL